MKNTLFLLGSALVVISCGGNGGGPADGSSDTLADDVLIDAGDTSSEDDTSSDAPPDDIHQADGEDAADLLDSESCTTGFTGDGCDLCTYSGQGAACEPRSPRDFFDMETIRALTLEDLGFVVTQVVEGENGTVIEGDWNGGVFPALDAEGNPVEQTIRSAAALYVPTDWPNTANPDRALVYAAHFEDKVRSAVAANIAVQYGMLVLYHGEYRSNWVDLGYPGRGELNVSSSSAVFSGNPCVPIDLVRGNYQSFSIPQTDMRAITLVQRLAEERGGHIEEVALRGFSKEGGGAWIAIAVDDRISVAAPGGYPSQDRLVSAQTWIDTFGCEGALPGNDRARTANESLAWYQSTPAGAAVLNAFDVSRNQDLFYPDALIIDGDVHLPGMHDGDYFALGSETPFLDSLEIPHRYVRKATLDATSMEDGGDLVSTTAVPVLLAELLVEGADALDAYYPRVTEATASIDGGLLQVEATIEGDAEQVLLWWSWSDDRSWSEVGQAEWLPVELALTAGAWTGTVDLAADALQSKAIGWYVESLKTFTLGTVEHSRLDASPVRFLQQPEPKICEPVSTPFCVGY